MVAYSFSADLASKVEDGSKRQTVRRRGKRRHARLGEALQLYAGMRTDACRKLVDPDPACAGVDDVEMILGEGVAPNVRLNGRPLPANDVIRFAHAGGFTGANPAGEMMTFYLAEHGPGLFDAVRIRW